jgi:hypothetical protein
VTILNQVEDCVELGAIQFGLWNLVFHFAGKLGVSSLIKFGVSSRLSYDRSMSPSKDHRFFCYCQ